METRRYFVRIEAHNKRALAQLGHLGLDIFEEVAAQALEAQRAEAVPYSYQVGGLLNMEQIEQLALNGYRITIEEEASKRARAATTVIDFDQWLKEMGE